jgi:hypothetical protein
MKLSEALARKREAVLDRWFQAVIATYPEDAASFIRRESDPFHNPVGHTVRASLERILDGLAAGAAAADLVPALDGIVRIRAVQGFTPSAAVAFVFELKGILRRVLAGEGAGADDGEELGGAIDRLALEAFDVYARCRETLFDIRVRELKEHHLMSARAGGCVPMTCGGPQSPEREGQ